MRPFTRSVSYRGPAVDLRQAADELRAEHLVTGQFFATGDEIQVTLEAIKIEDDSLLWSESLSIPKNNLSELGRQVAELIRIQLLPLLSSGGPVSEGTLPNDSEAYEIYLKSLSLGTDPEPNQQGIGLLERAVERDPGYAPAWAELSSRLHRRGAYAGGGAVDYNASDVAAVRALRLDPELVSAGTQLAMLRTERGDLLGAYDLAEDVVTRRPDSSAAHFAKSYVLRYAGLLNDSAAECEAALKLDPTDSGLRSCGLLYRRLGNFTRSKYFYALDAGSLWQKLVLAIDYIVEGDPTKALADYRQLDHSYFFWRTGGRVLEAFLEEPTELEAATRSAMELFATIVDGETLFHSAGTFAYCGQSQAALDLLNRAVELSYCAVDLDTYSPFSSLRDDKEFQRIHQAAVDCQQRFLEHRAKREKERSAT